MKLNTLIIATTTTLVMACASETTESNAVANISIEGMTCEMGCAKGIEKELSGKNGVASAEVNFEDKTATISFDKTKISETEIEAIIENMNDGQYNVEIENSHSNGSSIETNGESDIEASAFTIQLPNLFSVFKTII